MAGATAPSGRVASAPMERAREIGEARDGIDFRASGNQGWLFERRRVMGTRTFWMGAACWAAVLVMGGAACSRSDLARPGGEEAPAPTIQAGPATTEAVEVRPDETSPPKSVPDSTVTPANEGAASGLVVERAAPVGEIQTEPGPGEVKLWISNQSFDDDPIHITVWIDGVLAVDEPFEALDQHNWIAFDLLGLEPGEHILEAKSGTGVSLSAELTVVADAPRWAVLDYWFYPGEGPGRHFTFDQSDRPIGFA